MLGRQRDLDAVRDGLTGWLQGKLSAPDLQVSLPVAPKAGLSNETFLVDVSWTRAGRPHSETLVVRLKPTDFLVFPEYDLARQVRVMRCLSGSAVPVPRVRWFEDDERVLRVPFYVMDKVDGEIPSEVPPYHTFGWVLDAPPERRARLWWSGIDTLARIHRVDWRTVGLSFLGVPGPGTGPLDAQLDYYERYLDWVREGRPQPVLDAALAWLRAHRYTPARVSLCWGDSRLPNMIFRDDAVAAVLDWEMAFLGDPEADLGWWIFLDWAGSEGYGMPRLPGFPGPEETIRRYEAATGWRVEHAEYQEILAAFRFGVIMARIAARLKEIGAPTPTEDFERDNVCTQRLAVLLGLPPPGGGQREVTRIDEVTVRLQFELTGPGGSTWHLVCEKGRGTRHEGPVDRPDVSVTATAHDWEAIQRGELDRTEAFLGGRLKVEGDLTLLMQLEDTIARLGAPDAGSRP